MRPGQNKRMRGGRPNNRKAPNPLTRSYESNGPDVKIRGTAHHVGEKYLQLARDAQSSGDPVMAESYLQHAEHYFRLIAAAQQAQQQAALGVQRSDSEADDDDDDDDFTGLTDRFASPPERFAQAQAPTTYAPQPPANSGQPYQQERPYYNNGNNTHNSERPYEARAPRPERNYQERSYQDRNYQDRNGNGQDRNNQDRNFQDRGNQDRGNQERNTQERPNQDRSYQDRNGNGQERTYQDRNGQERPPYQGQDRNGQERNGQERNGQERQGQDRNDRNNRNNRRDYREPREPHEPRPVMQETETALPAFITAPVRIPPEHVEQPADEPMPSTMNQGEPEGDAFLLRPRRRRRTKAEMQEFRNEASNASDPVGE